jgi:hypothetical protein
VKSRATGRAVASIAVEVTAVELHEHFPVEQPPLDRIETETVKLVAAGGQSAVPQGLLMSCVARGGSVRLLIITGEQRMTNGQDRRKRFSSWTIEIKV